MSLIRNDLVRRETKKARRENLSRWRSLDPMLLPASLALSAFGICAVYVAGTRCGVGLLRLVHIR